MRVGYYIQILSALIATYTVTARIGSGNSTTDLVSMPNITVCVPFVGCIVIPGDNSTVITIGVNDNNV